MWKWHDVSNKLRKMDWNEVIGQKEVQERLLKMVAEDRLPHALMLCGPTGVGKMALALAFACHLLDDGRTSSKAMLAKMEHPDLHFTFPPSSWTR